MSEKNTLCKCRVFLLMFKHHMRDRHIFKYHIVTLKVFKKFEEYKFVL